MIKVQNLIFDYPGTRALDNVSFEIEAKTITALVGPNGAGKTTLLRSLCALDSPISGKLFIDEIDVLRFPKKIHSLCSFLPDFYGLYDALTVLQCLKFTAMSYHLRNQDKQIQQVIERMELTKYKDTPAGQLSRGWRQRLAIAQSILPNPKVLFLDEPASGLDPEARMHLSKLLLGLQSEGMTIIVSSHILSELQDYSSHMLMIKNGKVTKHCRLDEPSEKEKPLPLEITFTELNEEILSILKQNDRLSVLSVGEKSVVVEFNGQAQERHQLLKTLIKQDLPVCEVKQLKPSMAEVYIHASDETGHKDDN